MKKIILILILGIIVIFILGLVGYNFLISNKPDTSLVSGSKIIDKQTIGIEQVSFLLYSLNAYKLHKVPFSNNNPRIEIAIGEEFYISEVIENRIITTLGRAENKDISIVLSREEFLKILNSENLKQAVQESVAQEKMGLELVAGKPELLAKGYLSLYTEITGESV